VTKDVKENLDRMTIEGTFEFESEMLKIDASLSKGKILVGGQLSFGGSDNSTLDTLQKYDLKNSSFQFNPNFGYFIKDNLAVGLSMNLGYSTSSQTYENSYNNTITKTTSTTNGLSYGFGVFARQYLKIADKFMFYINESVSLILSNNETKRTNSDAGYNFSSNYPATEENKKNDINLSVTPGLIYFLTPKLGLQTSFGNIYFNKSNSTDKNLNFDNHNNSSNYGINLNSSTFYLGLNYYF